ncbi:YbaN family protein [Kingella negevensis]|uniref:YbaN family protein n=1 Tax=Kingella negevensis TaxID=1522312 RepID=UPI0032B2B0FE
MTPIQREWLFWAMTALMPVLPALLIWTMPPSRTREIYLRSLFGIVLLAVGTLCLLIAVLPQYLPHSQSLSAWTFRLMTTLLFGIPSVMMFFLPKSSLKTLLINGLLWIAGAISLILGIIGAFLPVMPTVPFILLTAACWGRASPRFSHWLHQNKYFGPMVKNWEERRAISKRGKYTAWTMMSISSIGLLLKFPERWYVGLGTGLVCLCVGIWMSRLPDA